MSIYLLAYLVTMLVAAVPLTRFTRQRDLFTYKNGYGRTKLAITGPDNPMLAALFGLLASVAWPALLTLAIIARLAEPASERAPRLTRAQRKQLRDERQRIELESQIARAEREVGIRE